MRLDISADSLVLENDKSLKYYRAINARYGSDDYLIITYTPEQELFEQTSLDDLRELRDSLAAIERVKSVISILDVPLIQSPPVSLSDLEQDIPTLESASVDRTLARQELLQSPVYRNNLVSEDGSVTALQVNFRRDDTYLQLRNARDALREKQLTTQLNKSETAELKRLTTEFKHYTSELIEQEASDIQEIRDILDQHRDKAQLNLGGLPMIVTDMMDFVRHDIQVFGIGVLVILALLLTVIFRQLRWVVLPFLTALVASIMVIGYLGFVEWRVTIVSSNFLALLLIFSLSLSIHLIVRYRELELINENAEQRYLVRETVRSKVVPCFYTVITTMVAFASLVTSDIRPVIDFGWIMVIGLAISFILAFTLFPCALLLLKPVSRKKQKDYTGEITGWFARLIERFGHSVLAITFITMLLCVIAMSQLSVENRFIDNFKQSTEIYQGMYLVDHKLGGTTPLDVIINAPAHFTDEPEPDNNEDEYDEDAEFFAELEAEITPSITVTSYWFNNYGLRQAGEIHDYLDSLRESGKVLSISTAMEMLKQLNEGELLDDPFLALLHKRMPDEMKRALIDPYLSEDGNQLRFSLRVYESDPTLKRKALLQKIEHGLDNMEDVSAEQVNLTGMVVLYNNLLQSLFRSQILTLGTVFFAILIMFALLFRSVKIASVAIIPNIIAAVLVLGLMGALSIPLDIMTITIAAISIGIAVDDTIHYVHRFGTELKIDGDYRAAVKRSHGSIGRAMYYTTITIIVGFSILSLSDFITTIYFGLLTAFAMFTALLADLTILPLLLVMVKPFKKPDFIEN